MKLLFFNSKNKDTKILPCVRNMIWFFTKLAEKELTKRERQRVSDVKIEINSDMKDVVVLVWGKRCRSNERGLIKMLTYDWYGTKKNE